MLAQTEKKPINEKFFEFDLYPFEFVESGSKWGLMFKPVYERSLAISYLKRNFHYNNRVDTLVNNNWLALPFYDKFERWSYGARFQFIAGIRNDKVDIFTVSGEILGSNVTEFSPEKINKERSDRVISMKTSNKWKWYYEGDFYNSNVTIYFQSPSFDKLEIQRDTSLASFNFTTEIQDVLQCYNVVGHELSGNVVDENLPAEEVIEEEKSISQVQETAELQKEINTVQPEAVVSKTEISTANSEAAIQFRIQAAVTKALKEADDACERERLLIETRLKALADKEIIALKAELEKEIKARVTAELKAIAEAKRADEAEKEKLIAVMKEENASSVDKEIAADTAQTLQDRNIIMQKIMERDKMQTYVFFKEKNLSGVKSADGNVLIYPVMKNIKITLPSNRELRYVSVFATIEFEMDGKWFSITKADFGGPEKIICSDGKTFIWNKSKSRYE